MSHVSLITSDDDISDFAGVRREIQIPWSYKGPFWNDDDDDKLKEIWQGIDITAGTVALTDEYVDAMGLPRAQRFPWDENKGVYVLNGWHALHCLTPLDPHFDSLGFWAIVEVEGTGSSAYSFGQKRLHTAILEAKHGLPQSTHWEHALHCIDALRQDTICNADDTPRYTGESQPAKSSGMDQIRKCRDWGKVEEWARGHTACWRYINGSDPDLDSLERYKFCPPGSPYND